MKLFKNRITAGELLGKELLQYKNNQDVIILALPRGGVPVGFQVAKMLNVPLDIFLVRKLGVPGQEELAIGAVASGGTMVLNEDVLHMIHLSPQVIETIKQKEMAVLQYRESLYRGNHPASNIKKKIIILVDDGIATGATIRASIQALKKLHCKKIIVAVPVAPLDTYELISKEADEVCCLQMPFPFYAISNWYQDFSQISDEEVQDWLTQARNL